MARRGGSGDGGDMRASARPSVNVDVDTAPPPTSGHTGHLDRWRPALFVAWAAALTDVGRSDRHRRQDGAALLQKKGEEERIYVVSAFAARQRMVLGQTKVGDKWNEIVDIEALLELLE